MKTYEVFTEKYSKIYQADGIESVIRKHHKVSNDEIVAVTIADRPDLLSKVDQLEPEGEEIDQGRVEEIVKQFDPTNQLTWQEAVMFRQGIKFGYSEKSTPPPQQPNDSAGEGVSDEEIEDMAYQNNWGLSEDFAITFQEGFTDGAKWMRSKLTRPTVSEGEDGCKNYEADDTTGMNCKWCGDPKWVHDEVRLSPTQQPSEGEIQKFYDKYSKVYHYDQNDPKQTQLTNRRITGNCVAIHGKAGALNIVFDEIRKMYYEQILTLRQEGESAEFQIIMNRID